MLVLSKTVKNMQGTFLFSALIFHDCRCLGLRFAEKFVVFVKVVQNPGDVFAPPHPPYILHLGNPSIIIFVFNFVNIGCMFKSVNYLYIQKYFVISMECVDAQKLSILCSSIVSMVSCVLLVCFEDVVPTAGTQTIKASTSFTGVSMMDCWKGSKRGSGFDEGKRGRSGKLFGLGMEGTGGRIVWT